MSVKEMIEYRFIARADAAQVELLYRDAGWWEDDFSADFFPDMIAGSFCFVAAFAADGAMLGMARAISDGGSDAYIQDVTVRQDHRHAGIGGKLVEMLTERLRACGIDWIGLIAAPGTESFYRELGFDVMDGYIPMRHKL